MALPQLFLHDAVATEVYTELMRAASNGDHKAVKELLGDTEARNTTNQQDIAGFTALMYAAKNGHTRVVRRLLRINGIELELQDANAGLRAVELAEKGEHTEIVSMVLTAMGITSDTINKPLPSYKGGPTGTRLHSAVHLNNYLLVRALLNVEGMKVDNQNDDGRTALFDAVDNDHVDTARLAIASLLLSKGANPNHALPDGTTVLMRAVDRGSLKMAGRIIESVLALPENERNWDARNKAGLTAVGLAEARLLKRKYSKDEKAAWRQIIVWLYGGGRAKEGLFTPYINIPNALKAKK